MRLYEILKGKLILVGARELLVPTYKLFLHSSAIVYYLPKLVIGNATEIHGAVLGSCPKISHLVQTLQKYQNPVLQKEKEQEPKSWKKILLWKFW